MTGDGTKMYAVAGASSGPPGPPVPAGIYTNFLPTVTRQHEFYSLPSAPSVAPT